MTPTGMGAAELAEERENKDEAQAATWRMPYEQMVSLVRMATAVVGHTGKTLRAPVVTVGSVLDNSPPEAATPPRTTAHQDRSGPVNTTASPATPPRAAPSPPSPRPSASGASGVGSDGGEPSGAESGASCSTEAELSVESGPPKQAPKTSAPKPHAGVLPPVLQPRPLVSSAPAVSGAPVATPAGPSPNSLPTSSKPGSASGRSRRPSAADQAGVAALDGTNEVVDFMRGNVEATNAAKREEARIALETARMQTEMAERQAERQFRLDERRYQREGEIAMRRLRSEEQRAAAKTQQANNAETIKTLEVLQALYQRAPSQDILDRICALGGQGSGGSLWAGRGSISGQEGAVAAGGLDGGMGTGGVGQSAASRDGGVEGGGDGRVTAGGDGESAPCGGGTAAGGEFGEAVGGGGGGVLSGGGE